MAGLTPTGFETKTLETIQSEISAELKSRIATTLDTDAASPLGQIIGVLSSQLRQLWELAAAVYSGQYPDSASDFSLTALAVLTGTNREPATRSTVTCTVNVDPGTYGIGTLVAHVAGDATLRFVNVAAVTNGGAVPANFSAAFESEETGPIRANAGTLTTIAEAVAGWNSVTNPADAVLGTDEETDAALRLRRESELTAVGSTTVDAIRVDLLQTNGVISVGILENDDDIVDGDGLPPHSIECIVRGGADVDLARVIFQGKAAGIQTYGSDNETYEDSSGNLHIVAFTRPTVKNIYLEIDLLADDATYGGDTAIKEALVDFGDTIYGVGDDVVLSKLVDVIFNVAGVLDVTAIRVGLAPSPVQTTNFVIAVRELADLDTARILVAATFT